MIELAPNNAYGLSLRTPLLAAAGTLGYGVEYTRLIDVQRLGALVTRTTSLQSRRPALAAPPRLIETPAGLLVTGGDVNPGLRYVAERYAPQWAAWDTPVLVSVGGATAEQCAEVARNIEGVEGVAGVEFNLARFGANAAGAVALLRTATQLPLLVKLPCDAPDMVGIAQAAVSGGADAMVLGPPLGLHIDGDTGMRYEGWLCGPALRPLALRRAAELVAAVEVPVIGGGGVASVADAQAFLHVGVAAVSLGSVLLADPLLVDRIAAEMT